VYGSPESELGHALNLSALIEAIGTRRAETNFVFVDACRGLFEKQLDLSKNTGLTPLDIAVGAQPLRRTLKTFYGAAPDDKAWTLPASEVFQHGTVFSKSLLRALRGEALDLDDDGRFAVMANRLLEKTARLVGETARAMQAEYAMSIKQVPEGVGTLRDVPFHVPETVIVDLEIELSPARHAPVAEAHLFSVKRPDDPQHDREVALDPHPAHLQVSSGKYQLQVYNVPGAPERFRRTRNHIVIPETSHWRFEIDG